MFLFFGIQISEIEIAVFIVFFKLQNSFKKRYCHVKLTGLQICITEIVQKIWFIRTDIKCILIRNYSFFKFFQIFKNNSCIVVQSRVFRKTFQQIIKLFESFFIKPVVHKFNRKLPSGLEISRVFLQPCV